jgi:2-keto-4-pentenoate hydratase/2-oxohepta-3-ene-1,7-dioic acid hydratase in catechol pathway
LPGKVVAVGLNYRAHAEELSMTVQAEPILFMKPRTAVIGPGESIVLPARSAQVDYEAELAVVVGRRCKDVTTASAAGYVAGYTCGNDVTARDLQKLDGQWTRAKSFDTFCPLGPWIVPEAPSDRARVSALLDGAEVQHGFVGDMIVTPLELLSFVSGIMTLEPGDVVMTGTPPGVGPVRDGQTVSVVVEEVGALSNPVAAVAGSRPAGSGRAGETAT